MSGTSTLIDKVEKAAEQASENTLLKVVARFVMAVGIPLACAIAGWWMTGVNSSLSSLNDWKAHSVTLEQFADAMEAIQSIDKRATTLETTTALGRIDRISFQDKQIEQSAEILRQISILLQGQAGMNSTLIGVVQRLEQFDKRMDVFDSRLNNVKGN